MNTNDKYICEVHRLCDTKLVRQNSWKDVKQDEFVNRYVSGIISSSFEYARALDAHLDRLEEARRKISGLLGDDSVFPSFVGYQHERGDIADGISQPFQFYPKNINFR